MRRRGRHLHISLDPLFPPPTVQSGNNSCQRFLTHRPPGFSFWYLMFIFFFFLFALSHIVHLGFCFVLFLCLLTDMVAAAAAAAAASSSQSYSRNALSFIRNKPSTRMSWGSSESRGRQTLECWGLGGVGLWLGGWVGGWLVGVG